MEIVYQHRSFKYYFYFICFNLLWGNWYDRYEIKLKENFGSNARKFGYDLFIGIAGNIRTFLTSNASSVEASSVGVTKYVPKGLGSYWLYIDKNTTNKILKSALAGSVFIPGSGVTINTAKYLLALAGIWGSVNRGIIIKVINAHTTPLVSYSWQ